MKKISLFKILQFFKDYSNYCTEKYNIDNVLFRQYYNLWHHMQHAAALKITVRAQNATEHFVVIFITIVIGEKKYSPEFFIHLIKKAFN